MSRACLCARQPDEACFRTWSAVIRALHPPLKLPILFCFSALTDTIHRCSMPLRTVSASFGNLAISCSLVPESHTLAKSVPLRRTSKQPHTRQGGRIQVWPPPLPDSRREPPPPEVVARIWAAKGGANLLYCTRHRTPFSHIGWLECLARFPSLCSSSSSSSSSSSQAEPHREGGSWNCNGLLAT
jgi:hypothetical protein